MKSIAAFVIAVFWLSGCVKSQTTLCDDGRTCPAGFQCDDVHGLCITNEQATVCAALAEGAQCSADRIRGICDRGLCVPGCGDGAVGISYRDRSEEQCDDGDFESHDGCSSACKVEVPVWSEIPGPSIGRVGHMAGYHVARQELVILGGGDSNGVRADQWVRDAAGKWSVDLTTPIGSRRLAAMAYDTTRSKLVLFGGLDGQGNSRDDVWELGAVGDWTEVTIDGARPPARFGHSMVYDPVRQRFVMFGGSSAAVAFLDDTWTFDAATGRWTKLSIAGPGARRDAATAWDGARVVLFGGIGAGFGIRGDTWVFDPAAPSWTMLADTGDPGQPVRRHGAVMASREAGKVVMFGGLLNGVTDTSEAWELSGTTWTRIATTSARVPTGRVFATITFDPSSSALVLVGGLASSDPGPLEDVWHLGTEWAEQSTLFPLEPSPRYTPMMYDPTAREMLMFGGLGDDRYADTWAFGGESSLGWMLRGPVPVPSPNCSAGPALQIMRRVLHVVAFDSLRDRGVTFGGLDECDRVSGLTFEWDRSSTSWRHVDVVSPPARIGGAMAFDATRNVTVLFGGLSNTFSVLDDTWEYSGTWTRVNASGPGPLAFPSMAYDPSRGGVVLVDDVDSRTWLYADGAWSELVVDGRVDPPRPLASMTYDVNLGLVLFGGGPPQGDQRFNDLWQLREVQRDGATSLRWERLNVIGEVPRPRATSIVADPCREVIVMYGGLAPAGTGQFGDTRQLRFQSLTPDEQCGNGRDDDDDLQIDTADPDCVNSCGM